MNQRKRSSVDRLLTGLVIGILVPVLFFMLIYQIKYGQMDFTTYVKSIWQMKLFLKILSLCVFPNLGFFLMFYRRKYDMAARGVILATFIYAFVVLIAKLI
jgi:hypothetical protein